MDFDAFVSWLLNGLELCAACRFVILVDLAEPLAAGQQLVQNFSPNENPGNLSFLSTRVDIIVVVFFPKSMSFLRILEVIRIESHNHCSVKNSAPGPLKKPPKKPGKNDFILLVWRLEKMTKHIPQTVVY